MARQHTQQRNVYHICMRCGTTQPLAQMRWQNGLLLCEVNKCVDTEVIGKHDLAVAQQVSVNRHELEPDPKLTQPTTRKSDQLEVLY